METKTLLADNNTIGVGKGPVSRGGETKKFKFPDALVPFADKLNDGYGIAIGEIIASDWFGGGGRIIDGCNFMARQNYIRNKRLFVRGEGDASYFKDNFKRGDNDLDFINIDWSNINWAEKFCRIVSNGISDKNYKLDIRSSNRLAVMARENKRDYYRKYMVSRSMLQKAKKLQGIDLMPKDYIPEDEQALEMQMEIKERPKIEMAEELMIDYVLNSNNWEYINRECNKDLVDSGLIIVRVWLDKNDGIKVAYIDSENYVHSRIDNNNPDTIYYEGVVETITLSDLRRESGWNDAKLKLVAKQAGPKPGINYDTCSVDDLLDQKVHILRFAYKTSKDIVYKKKERKGETFKMNRRDESYSGPEELRVSKTLDTWLEGNFVVGTKHIYGYKECENLYDDLMNKCHPPFVKVFHGIYENRLTAFSDNIEAPALQLQKISLKIQQLINELKPDLIEVDLDLLAELDDGKGGAKELLWQKALSLMNTKGVVFSKTTNMGEDGIKSGTAVRHVGIQQGTALIPLLNAWAQYYNMIRENTGVNPARDGSAPNDTLVGLNQMAQLASNTVTKNIVDNAVYFKKKICEVISSRLHAIFKYSDAAHLKELYTNVVGKQMLDAVEALKDRHLHEFGFTLEMIPTNEEIAEFKEDLAIALKEGTIDVQIKAEAVRIARSNIKLAIEYVAFHRRKFMKQRQEEQMMLAKNKSQNDAAAAQAKAQSDTQAYAAKTQMDIEKEAAMSRIRVNEKLAIQQIEAPIREQEFKEDVFLEKIKNASDWDMKKYMEDRKDERTSKQATQQSKILKQRNTDGQPIDFENEDNWMLE